MSAALTEPLFSRLPTASAVERAIACPGSQRLPHFEHHSEPAAGGTAVHRFLETRNIEEVPEEYRERCEAIDVSTLPVGAQWGQEVAVAWDCETDTGRELGRGLKRDYRAAKPTEYVGTADAIGLTADAVVVFDFKAGNAWLKPAEKSWQLKTLALAAARAYGRTKARIGLCFLREGAERPAWSVADLDEMDLDLIAAELRELHGRIQDPAAPIVEGEHCRYCPAISHCPPKLALLNAVCTSPAAEQPGEITPENATAIYHRMRAVEQVLSAVKERIAAFSFSHPIDLGDGRVYGPVQVEKEVLDGISVQAVVAKQHGPDVAMRALELKASKASLERAIAEVAPRGKKAAMVRGVLDELRATGGISTKLETQVREHGTARG